MLIYDKADHSLPVIKDLELVLSILKLYAHDTCD